jgi:hypothetical protein
MDIPGKIPQFYAYARKIIQKITLSRVASYNNTAARPEQIILAEKYIPCFY